jgi:hypothetical protein
MKKILLIIVAGFFLSGCNRLDQHQPLTSQIIKFSEGESISEKIKATRNNLNTVSICIRNPQRELIPLTFTLTESTTQLRTLTFSSGNIENEDCTKFKFDPITDSQGKVYTTTIKSLPPSKDKLIPTVLTVEKHEDITHYKTFYYQSTSEVIRESLTQFYYRLFLDPWFMIFWAGLAIFIIVKIVRSKSEF